MLHIGRQRQRRHLHLPLPTTSTHLRGTKQPSCSSSPASSPPPSPTALQAGNCTGVHASQAHAPGQRASVHTVQAARAITPAGSLLSYSQLGLNLLTWRSAFRSPGCRAGPAGAAPAGGIPCNVALGRSTDKVHVGHGRAGWAYGCTPLRCAALPDGSPPQGVAMGAGAAHQLSGCQWLPICEQRDTVAPQQHLKYSQGRSVAPCCVRVVHVLTTDWCTIMARCLCLKSGQPAHAPHASPQTRYARACTSTHLKGDVHPPLSIAIGAHGLPAVLECIAVQADLHGWRQ